jgi:hypothetical protein
MRADGSPSPRHMNSQMWIASRASRISRSRASKMVLVGLGAAGLRRGALAALLAERRRGVASEVQEGGRGPDARSRAPT